MLPFLHLVYFQLGPVKIYTWGFFVALGFLITLFLLIKKYPQEKDMFIELFLYILVGAIIGARVFFIFFYSNIGLEPFKNFFKIWDGGMSSMGGIAGGTLAAYL